MSHVALTLVPACWLLAGLLNSSLRHRPWLMRRAGLACAVAALTLVAVAAFTAQPAPAALTSVDAISLVLAGLVSFIGAVVLRFSHAYLHGDPRQGGFLRDLCLVVASVSLLVIAGTTWLLFAGWVAMSLSLHRLLVFRGERPGARIAARKKFLLARLGDALLGLALLSLSVSAGSADIQQVLEMAAQAPRGQFTGEALLLVLAAVLKSAQFPTHGWLTQVMEAPTPVSALLHAGVVNAGGFLLVRFADVLLASAAALHLALLVGGVTALFGSLVMLTQRSVKVSLAYSTVAQMGFMLLQCGLGAFSSALLHIVAHSLYKAHAFLSSGSIVDLARGSGDQGRAEPLHPALAGAALLLAAGIFAGWSLLFGMTPAQKPAIAGLGVVLLLGMTHLVIQSARGAASKLLLLRVAVTATVVGGLYFTLQALSALLFENALPSPLALDATQWTLLVLLLLAFALVTLLQWLLPALQHSRFGHALWVHLSHGLYADRLFDRVVGAHALAREPLTESRA